MEFQQYYMNPQQMMQQQQQQPNMMPHNHNMMNTGHMNQMLTQQQMMNQQAIGNHHKMDSKKENKASLGSAKKPKGRMSSYTYFVQTCREEHRKKHPTETVNFTEFSKKCGERWKQMTDNEKKRFALMADKDKQRYDREMSTYTPPAGEPGGRKRRKKDPNAPKRPLSAFFLFCHDERPAVRALHPTYGVGEVAKDLGEKWAKILPEKKTNYEAKAQLDKARYEIDVQKYKDGLAKGSLPSNDADDDDEEEDDDETNE